MAPGKGGAIGAAALAAREPTRRTLDARWATRRTSRMYASCGFLANTFLTYAARKVRNVSKVTRGKALAAALLWAPSLSQKEDRLQPQEPKPMPAACLQRGQAVVGQPREQMQASAATGKHGPVKLLAAMLDLPTRWTGWCARSRVLSARFPIGARLAI